MRQSLLIVILSLVLASPAIASEDEPVWLWFADGGDRMMKLEVRLDQKVVFESTFHICHALRSSFHNKSQRTKRLEFWFKAHRAIAWSGYGLDETTPIGKEIEGNIWEAGADPDYMILGVWFGGHGAGYMNTLHIVFPYKKAEWMVAPGLVTVTYPVEETVGKSQWKPTSKLQNR